MNVIDIGALYLYFLSYLKLLQILASCCRFWCYWGTPNRLLFLYLMIFECNEYDNLPLFWYFAILIHKFIYLKLCLVFSLTVYGQSKSIISCNVSFFPETLRATISMTQKLLYFVHFIWWSVTFHLALNIYFLFSFTFCQAYYLYLGTKIAGIPRVSLLYQNL